MPISYVTRQRSILLFNKDGDVNPAASCQVFCYGDHGFMYGINGGGFYDLMQDNWLTSMSELGVKSYEGCGTEQHLRLTRIALRHTAVECVVTGQCMMKGVEMPWVVIRPR